MSKDDFTEFYFKENEKLLLKVIESVNTTVEECIKILNQLSKNENFTVIVTKE